MSGWEEDEFQVPSWKCELVRTIKEVSIGKF